MTIKMLNSILLTITISTTLVSMDEDIARRTCEALPSKDICQKALKKIWRIKKKLDTCCTDLDIKFDKLQDEIDSINAANFCTQSTPISTDAFTITESSPR